MKTIPAWLACATLVVTCAAETNSWPSAPLTLTAALDTALRQSPALLKGKQDLEEAYGLALQLRSAARPRLTAGGNARQLDASGIEQANVGGATLQFQNETQWGANIEVSQPLFTAGKITASLRAAKLTKDAALAQYQALVADTLVELRVTYDDALLAAELIKTQEASVELLTRELEDQKRRFDAGTVPRFNVLRAEVELANARPRLIKARNALRTAKNQLATQLGWDIPRTAAQDLPLELADSLAATPFPIDLPAAILQALSRRPELTVLRAQEKIRAENIRQARADYYPQLAASAGWRWQNKTFTRRVEEYEDGWIAGGQINWNLWDFGLTQGKVNAAQARREKARLEVEDTQRQVELEVRIAYSTFTDSKEVLDSQQKVIEQAEEALRLARARTDAGSGTQLDVLSAQTALTDTRTTYSQALRDYAVARARLERAVGEGTALKVNQ
jgi:outer membrane protein TolC